VAAHAGDLHPRHGMGTALFSCVPLARNGAAPCPSVRKGTLTCGG